MNDIYLEIVYKDVLLFVTGDYTPEEKIVMYNDDFLGYPGDSADFNSYNIKCGEQDIMHLLNNDVIEEIETLILDKYYN